MKKLFAIIAISAMPLFLAAQSCAQPCDKTACGPAGTKKEEAAVITTLRSDLQTVVSKMSQSSVSFDKGISELKVTRGSTDDESLLFISQAATSIRYELLSKLDASKLIVSLKDYKPGNFSTKQQMMAGLKKEIQLLVNQAERL
jgi:hypothetical protein